MTEPTIDTWDDGEYTSDEVIEAADHQGYLSMDDYIHDHNALAPDPSPRPVDDD
ncbi:hypothetical protein [Streptomyces sp. NPDC050546]|uniref:hypothetical protein n=1 Tax=Streptomyces sp. NPDC050546 TaxID=3365628 RepID=UPI0037A1368F